MRFQFDSAKAAENQRKHGVSFADAEGVFADPLAIHCVDPDSEGEQRFIGIGLGSAGRVLVVIYSMREQEIRLISVRRATKREVRDYEG